MVQTTILTADGHEQEDEHEYEQNPSGRHRLPIDSEKELETDPETEEVTEEWPDSEERSETDPETDPENEEVTDENDNELNKGIVRECTKKLQF